MKKLILFCLLMGASLAFAAPAYNATTPNCGGTPPTAGTGTACLYPGQSGLLFNAEQPATGTFSQQFQIIADKNQATANLSIECIWATTPGAFNYQIQNADTDATGNYVTLATAGTITSAPQAPGSGNFVARVDLSPWRGTFIRLYVNTQTANAVNGTCKVTR